MINIDKHYIIVSSRKDPSHTIKFSVCSTTDLTNGRDDNYLINFNLSILYGDKNWLQENSKMVNKIESIIERNDLKEFEFDGWQHEMFIFVNSKFTEMERWGTSATIETVELLEIFKSIQEFLLRWNSTEKLLNECKKAFEAFIKMDFKDTTRFDYVTKEKDIVLLFVFKDQLKMLAQEFVDSLKLPVHLIEGHDQTILENSVG